MSTLGKPYKEEVVVERPEGEKFPAKEKFPGERTVREYPESQEPRVNAQPKDKVVSKQPIVEPHEKNTVLVPAKYVEYPVVKPVEYPVVRPVEKAE